MGESVRSRGLDVSISEIQQALTYIDASDRDTWVKMAMAIKSELGDSGYAVWESWSATDDSFRDRSAKAVWRSVKSNGRVGIGSLFYLAKLNGYQRNPQRTTPSLYRGNEYREFLTQQRQRRQRVEKSEEARTKSRQVRAARRYGRFFNSLGRADEHAAYLVKKGIQPHGIRKYVSKRRVCLVVPVFDELGMLLTLQIIGNEKRFLKGARSKGGYFKFYGIPGRIVICEGWATAATIFEATGYTVIAAFSDHNLIAVAKAVANQYPPDARIVIAGDDDCMTKNNPGKTAMLAALAIIPNARMCLPGFPSNIKRSKQTTDFNDLARVVSRREVQRQIRTAFLTSASYI